MDMGRRPCSLALLVASVVILLSMPQGLGRKIHVMRQRHYVTSESTPETPLCEEKSAAGLIGREMMVAVEMDYKEPGANTNTRNGGLFDTSSPGPSPPLH